MARPRWPGNGVSACSDLPPGPPSGSAWVQVSPSYSHTSLSSTEDFDEIVTALGAAGVKLERWKADRELADDADSDKIIAA